MLGFRLLSQVQVIEGFDDPDLPGRNVLTGHAREGVDVGPFERRNSETGCAFAPPEPEEHVQQIEKTGRWRRLKKLLFQLLAPFRLPRPLQQGFKMVPIRLACLIDSIEPKLGLDMRD